jgi:signal transduction histidine kinase
LAASPSAPRADAAVLVLYDVTDLVKLDEMRVELIAVASHELRTPPTTMRMTLLMLQEGASDPSLVRRVRGSTGRQPGEAHRRVRGHR